MKTRKNKALHRALTVALMGMLIWTLMFVAVWAKSASSVTVSEAASSYVSGAYCSTSSTNLNYTGTGRASFDGTVLTLTSQSGSNEEGCTGGNTWKYYAAETTVYLVAEQDMVVTYEVSHETSGAEYAGDSDETGGPTSERSFVASVESGTTVPAGATFWFKLTSRNGEQKVKSENTPPTYAESTNISLSFSATDVGGTEGNAFFFVPNDVAKVYYYDYLDKATAAAQNTTSKRVIVSASGYARNSNSSDVLTVPEGVELAIPYEVYDEEGSFGPEPNNYLSQATGYTRLGSSETGKVAYAAKVLTVESGKCMEVYGSLNVNGQRQNNGQPMPGVVLGGYGKLVLGTENTGAPETDESEMQTQLVIKSGGKLYAYGYITGTGLVDVESDGTVHELLQMACWPGGGNGANWNGISTDNRDLLFILSQYYVQNIEAPVKIHYGATMNTEAVFAVSGTTQYKSAPYITTDEASDPGMFLMSNSNTYILRVYDVSKDRMNYFIKGGAAVINSLQVTLSGSYSINSSEYILPINHSMTISVEPGASVSSQYKLALLPGAELIVKEGASATLTNEAYIFDVADFTSYHFFNRAGYTANPTPNHCPVPYVATKNGVSPYAAKLDRFTYGENNTKGYYPQVKNITTSAKLRVDGVLNLSGAGALLTTNGGQNSNKVDYSSNSTDKVIEGSGVIINNGTPVDKDIRVGYAAESALLKAYATYALANLAGVGDLIPMAAGTYYGQDSGDWYSYMVTVDSAENLTAFTNVTKLATVGLVDNTATRYNTETKQKETVSNALGFVSNYLAESATVGSTFSFEMDAASVPVVTGGGETVTMTAAPGGVHGTVKYTLSGVSADVMLGVSNEGTVTTVETVASNAGYATISTVQGQFPANMELTGYFTDRNCTAPATSENLGGVVYAPMEAIAATGSSAGTYSYAYMKVSEAVDAANSTNSYVTVLQDRSLTDPIVVDSDQNITLDLGGKTLTGKVATVFNGATGQKLVTNNGTMRLLNGTITFNGAHTTTDYADANFAATVYNLGTIEYIEDVILQETAGNIYNAALLNGAGGMIKEIRSGTLKGNSYSAGTAIHNRGTIETIGTSGGTVEIIGRRGIALRGNGRIDTIGGEGSIVNLTSNQRGINTHASTASVGTIGENGSTVNITMKSSGMGRTAIFGEDSGVFEVIGGKGSTLNITVEEGTIYTQTAIRVTKAPADGVVVIGDTGSTINITVVNNVAADAKDPGQVIGINSSTTTKIGASGSSMNINVNQKGKGTAYGIYNNGTIKSLGATDASIEIVSNYDGIYNASSKTISAISGDVVVISTDETGSYYGLNNAGTIGVINSGDFYHVNGRDNAVLNPDSQNYPTARHGLSKDTRMVTLSDGTTTYDCYYVTVVDPAAGTVKGEDVIDQYVTLADAVEEYLALEDKTGVYVVLYDDCAETSDISLDEDIYLDLNGHTVTLAEDGLTVANNVTLYGMDSKTNAYLTDGSIPGQIVGTISGKIDAVHSIEDGANAGKHYAVVTKTVDGKNVTQFHRVGVSVSAYRFFVSSTDMTSGYLSVEGTFRSTRDGFDAMDKLGFVGVSETIPRVELVKSETEDGKKTYWKDNYANGDKIPVHYTFETTMDDENTVSMQAWYAEDSAQSNDERKLVLKTVLEEYLNDVQTALEGDGLTEEQRAYFEEIEAKIDAFLNPSTGA